ncbi:hypothetical protein AB0F17_54655 [Nonomuraea sp. NPDC026600]|uniref:hypothetical protein n=1 Tax=Nonomuraea sp. NPDC026600 TaxID=3155363 RepID=UPI0033E39077
MFQDGYLTQAFKCGHCAKPDKEIRKLGSGRPGPWLRYCSTECRQAAKRVRDREKAQERYRLSKGLCLKCGLKIDAEEFDPYCSLRCDDVLWEIRTAVS